METVPFMGNSYIEKHFPPTDELLYDATCTVYRLEGYFVESLSPRPSLDGTIAQRKLILNLSQSLMTSFKTVFNLFSRT